MIRLSHSRLLLSVTLTATTLSAQASNATSSKKGTNMSIPGYTYGGQLPASPISMRRTRTAS